MFKQILVPLDGSPFGEHSLPWAMKIAGRTGATVSLLHVYTPLATAYFDGGIMVDPTLDNEIKGQMQGYLTSILGRVQSARPGLNVTGRVVEGVVAAEIVKEAGVTGANLVVLTTHGRGPLGRFWLGSVADALVHQLTCSALLVRPAGKAVVLTDEPELRHILIPLDGTDMAEKILPPALALGKLTGADYTLTRMIRPVLPYDTPVEVSGFAASVRSVLDRVDELQGQLKREAQEYLDRVAARLRQEGHKVETKVDLDMQPAHAILQDVEEKAIDLVALETHGRKGLARMFLGSVADKVVRGARIPVLVHRAH
jgi:nucleotide-binding universal stress UspA family protein